MDQRSLSRRQFLQWSTISASTLALAACAGVSTTESGGEA
ncbi:MAG: twin-arginine translocation signal domain-containing protein [Caldilineaceae bacterium]